MMVAALALGLGACGGGDGALSKDASALLTAQVRLARDAAAQGDAATALVRLDGAREQLDRLERAGEVSSTRATEIAAAIDAAKAAVQTNITAPTTSTTSPPETEAPTTATTEASTTTTTEPPTTTTPPTTETTAPPDRGKGNNGNGHGGGD
jgi:hypothetical protein